MFAYCNAQSDRISMKPGMRNVDIYAILFIYFTLLYIQGTKHCSKILNHLQ